MKLILGIIIIVVCFHIKHFHCFVFDINGFITKSIPEYFNDGLKFLKETYPIARDQWTRLCRYLTGKTDWPFGRSEWWHVCQLNPDEGDHCFINRETLSGFYSIVLQGSRKYDFLNYKTLDECKNSECDNRVDPPEWCFEYPIFGEEYCTSIGASFPMWYFDSDFKECMPFSYNGCKGNSNRFFTKEDCEAACVRDNAQELCESTPDYNEHYSCYYSEDIQKENPFYNRDIWQFDETTKMCEQFTYFGCRRNRFFTKEACENACIKNIVPGSPKNLEMGIAYKYGTHNVYPKRDKFDNRKHKLLPHELRKKGQGLYVQKYGTRYYTKQSNKFQNQKYETLPHDEHLRQAQRKKMNISDFISELKHLVVKMDESYYKRMQNIHPFYWIPKHAIDEIENDSDNANDKEYFKSLIMNTNCDKNRKNTAYEVNEKYKNLRSEQNQNRNKYIESYESIEPTVKKNKFKYQEKSDNLQYQKYDHKYNEYKVISPANEKKANNYTEKEKVLIQKNAQRQYITKNYNIIIQTTWRTFHTKEKTNYDDSEDYEIVTERKFVRV